MKTLFRLGSLAVILVVGCSKPPALDCSSKAAYESSLKAMSQTLGENDRKKVAQIVIRESLPGMAKQVFSPGAFLDSAIAAA